MLTVPDKNTQFNFYQLLPCINDAEPSGRDNKLCSQLKSLRVTLETPHTSITPLEQRNVLPVAEKIRHLFCHCGLPMMTTLRGKNLYVSIKTDRNWSVEAAKNQKRRRRNLKLNVRIRKTARTGGFVFLSFMLVVSMCF